ncbi:murein hydrolase activator EnvC family protein [Nocardiopsis mangrovi]|uniref:Murein hydrolase activator EnvC family protein n=1 Tax=Nocardiopsis mangrovi TaxID=1179818 RepID=A0ABV9DP97_9ACTN
MTPRPLIWPRPILARLHPRPRSAGLDPRRRTARLPSRLTPAHLTPRLEAARLEPRPTPAPILGVSALLLPAVVALVALVALTAGPAAADHGPWRPPLDGRPVVLRAFDPPDRPWLPGHRGVDLAAAEGADIVAAGAGRVAFAGRVAGTGAVTVVHGKLRTTYLPVAPTVVRGDPVSAGTLIGTLADNPPHCPDRPCLHWGLRRGTDYLDPMSLLGTGEIRLLPLSAPHPARDLHGPRT